MQSRYLCLAATVVNNSCLKEKVLGFIPFDRLLEAKSARRQGAFRISHQSAQGRIHILIKAGKDAGRISRKSENKCFPLFPKVNGFSRFLPNLPKYLLDAKAFKPGFDKVIITYRDASG